MLLDGYRAGFVLHYYGEGMAWSSWVASREALLERWLILRARSRMSLILSNVRVELIPSVMTIAVFAILLASSYSPCMARTSASEMRSEVLDRR